MRLTWVDYPYGETGGDTLGYAGLIRELKPALTALGVEWHDRASICFHVCSPGIFGNTPESARLMKRKNTKHVVLTMWESENFIVGPFGHEGLNCGRADLIMTPNAWCSQLFYRTTQRPTTTIPLAVRPVPYRERSVPEGGWNAARPFQWLLVGATNPRKGLPQLSGAWSKFFGANNAMHLLIKSTFPEEVRKRLEETGEAELVAVAPKEAVPARNITHDARMVPRAELDAIYDAADAFIYPTMGEGWGMTLHEAMTAGLPVVATGTQGVVEYATPKSAHLLPATYVPIGSRSDRMRSDAEDGKFRYAYVQPNVIAEVMLDVMLHYDQAVARARVAAWETRQYSWERTAGRVLAEITQHVKLLYAA